MKTMTCKQMGGICDMPISGETPQEMMDNGTKHIQEMVEQGDEEHKKVLTMMDEMQKDPNSAREWNDKFMSDFEALPVD